MPKAIIFCADGTWNGPEEKTGVSPTEGSDEHGEVPGAQVTNVVKLFNNIAGNVTPETTRLPNEQESVLLDQTGAVVQAAKYIHGVGDSKNIALKVLGGTVGTGIIARIVRGYTFISRHYDPGDEIHITGFSRGAYTARALAGMMTNVGLLNRATYDPSDKEEAYRLGIGAWCKSREIMLQGKNRPVTHVVVDFVKTFFGKKLPDNGVVADVPIKSVAVWDTVGSLGIPIYVGNDRLDVFRFADTALSPKIANGFHAMSIDELRGDFSISRWDDRPGVTQVWFLGAHSDVGGGYPQAESGLSDIALDWLMKKLEGVGVKFSSPLIYTPATGNVMQAIHRPWERPPFDALPKFQRKIRPTDVVHATVVRRFTSDATYRPEALAELSDKIAAMPQEN